jgi:hypothetical protein
MGHNRKLVINYVAPTKEDSYAKRNRLSYVLGDLTAALNVSTACTVPSTDVVTMWENTEIRGVKPELSWKDVITENLL